MPSMLRKTVGRRPSLAGSAAAFLFLAGVLDASPRAPKNHRRGAAELHRREAAAGTAPRKPLPEESSRPGDYLRLADYYEARGRCSLSLDYLREAVASWESRPDPDRARIARARKRISRLRRRQGPTPAAAAGSRDTRCLPASQEWSGLGKDGLSPGELIRSLTQLAGRRIRREERSAAARMAGRARGLWEGWSREGGEKAAGAAAVADVYAALGELKEAESLYRKAVSLGRRFSLPGVADRAGERLRLIEFLGGRGPEPGKPPSARGEWEFLLRAAEGLSARGRHAQAVRAGASALEEADREFKPDDSAAVEAAARLARIYRAAGRPGELLRLARRLRAVRTKNPRLYLEAGRIFMFAEQLPQAEEMFLKASGLAPRKARAHVELGELYLRTGRFPEAAKSFKRALAAKPRSYWLHVRLAEAYQMAGRFDEEEETFTAARRAAGADARRLIELGYAGMRLKDFSSAKAAFDEAVETDVTGYLGLHHLASYYNGLGIYDKAEACLKQALAALRRQRGPSPDHLAHTMHNLARVYIKQKRFGEAEALCMKIISMRDKLSREYFPSGAMVMLGHIYSTRGKLAEAELMYKRARDEFKEDKDHYSEIQLGLAGLYARQGRRSEAEAIARRLLEQNEDTPLYPWMAAAAQLRRLAELFETLGDRSRAENLYRRLIDLGEDPPIYNVVARALIGLAGICETAGRPAEAEAYLRKASDLDGTYPGNRGTAILALQRLAAFYKDQRRREEALETEKRLDALRSAR